MVPIDPSPRCALHVARCRFHVARRVLHVERCALQVASASVTCCTLSVARCTSSVASASVTCCISVGYMLHIDVCCMFRVLLCTSYVALSLHVASALRTLHQRPLLLHQCLLHGARCPLSVRCTLHQCPLHVTSASVACRIGRVRCMLHRRWCGMHGACLCLECRCSTAPMSCLKRCCHATRQHLRRAQTEYAEYPQQR